MKYLKIMIKEPTLVENLWKYKTEQKKFEKCLVKIVRSITSKNKYYAQRNLNLHDLHGAYFVDKYYIFFKNMADVS